MLSWSPSFWARAFGRTKAWSLSMGEGSFVVDELAGSSRYLPGTDTLAVERRAFWTSAVFDSAGTELELRGLKHRDALELRRAFDEAASVRGAAVDAADERLQAELGRARPWCDAVLNAIAFHEGESIWFPRDSLADLQESRPTISIRRILDEYPELRQRLTVDNQGVIDVLDLDLSARVKTINAATLKAELRNRRPFFDSIESSPLTREQAAAVITFDNRVQVIAAAGSGKTSLMVARAAYSIIREIVPAERILALAFNADAAKELQDRIEERLAYAGISSVGLRASTFHSFGLSLIGKARGRKPRLASFIEQPGQDMNTIMKIVDELSDGSPAFRVDWDMFRLLWAPIADAPDGGESTPSEATYDKYDPQTRERGYATLDGAMVRSHGERLIADFLYLNGVTYQYERPYEHPVADSEHSQYRPDFYYPDVDVWHEHWALDEHGKPPKSFKGYAEGMAWKRQVHEQHQTTLIESTWADVVRSTGLNELQNALDAHGQKFDWNPDRPVTGRTPLKHEQLARLVRTFMQHVKSNSLRREDTAKSASRLPELMRHRAEVFLRVYWQIHDQWQARLEAEEAIDFEDMLVEAADALASGAVASEYDLVLVDEMQDFSQARARLVQGLVAGRGKYLLGVGDDWQSINRFAGADIGIVTSFGDWFGESMTLRLTNNFRSTQAICDVAGAFVQKNPQQQRKSVTAARPEDGDRPTLVRVGTPEEIQSAVEQRLQQLAARVEAGEISPDRGDKLSVYVLGRYNFERDLMPKRWAENLDVHFRTVHGSKGLEADFVILPNLVTGTYGFPSQIQDDPVLSLVMASEDGFAHSEERRLFYVGLTRARRGVDIITVRGRESPFVAELVKDDQVVVERPDGTIDDALMCPKCGEGTQVVRRGPRKSFWACSRFPACDFVDFNRPTTPTAPARPSQPKLVGDPDKCPKCQEGKQVVRKGPRKYFWGCSRYPACDFVDLTSPTS